MRHQTYFLVIVAQLLISFNLSAQFEGYFNNRYDLTTTSDSDFGYTIFEKQNEYIVAGKGTNSITGNREIFISSYTNSGILQWVKRFGDSVSSFILTRPDCMHKYNENRYYSVGFKRTPTSFWVHDEVMLTCYNGSFDTLWTSYYGDISEPYDTAYIFSQVKRTSDDQLILGGDWMPKAEAIRMCLIKTDTSGSMIWKKSYGNGNGYYRGYSVVETSDGGFALGGALFYIGQEHSGDPMVLKTDSLGNEQWMLNLGGDYPDHVAMLCNTNDGNFVAAYSYADSMYTQIEPSSRICLTKINNEGNILWTKYFGESRLLNYVNNIIETEDNSLLIVGCVVNEYPSYSGWVLKTTPNGDSLWFREYRNVKDSKNRNYLMDVAQTSDNGIISCGYILPLPPDTGYYDTWILKLDSLGCDTPGCDPTVGIPYQFKGDKNLEVYPNPAREQFVVGSSLFAEGNCIIQLFDLYGRKAKEIKVPKGEDQIIVDVAGQQPGLYLLRLSNGTGKTESVKVMVE